MISPEPSWRHMDSFEQLKTECMSCRLCGLCETRHNVVFGDGNEHADIVFIGEGPGENEDLQGVPFVGRAGKLLDEMLYLVGLDRTKVYICNMVKCRPPQNRDPLPTEREACSGWLDRQLELIDPKIVVCVGRIAAMGMIDPDFKITQQHGEWFDINGRKYMAVFHPAALLRDPRKKPDAFADFQKIRKEALSL